MRWSAIDPGAFVRQFDASWHVQRIANGLMGPGVPESKGKIFRAAITEATPGRPYSWLWCRSKLGTEAIHGISRTRRIACARRGSFSF